MALARPVLIGSIALEPAVLGQVKHAMCWASLPGVDDPFGALMEGAGLQPLASVLSAPGTGGMFAPGGLFCPSAFVMPQPASSRPPFDKGSQRTTRYAPLGSGAH